MLVSYIARFIVNIRWSVSRLFPRVFLIYSQAMRTIEPFFNRLPNFLFFGGRGIQVFGEKLPHSKVDKALVLPVVGFETRSTGPFNHASAGPKNCIVNSWLNKIMSSNFFTVAVNRLFCFGQNGYWTKLFVFLHVQTLVNQTKDL